MANPVSLPAGARIVIFGASGTGKTQLTAQILKHHDWCFSSPVKDVYYFYAHYQRVYQDLERELDNITFFNCLPTEDILETISDPCTHSVIVVDDFGKEAAKSDLVESLFVRGCHHMNITLILLTQQLFYPGTQRRTQSVNTTHYILMRNPAGADQVAILAKQRFPGKSKEFMSTYNKVISVPFAYLILDSDAKSDAKLMIRTGLFPEDDIIVYQFSS